MREKQIPLRGMTARKAKAVAKTEADSLRGKTERRANATTKIEPDLLRG
jgi:hypothetical protein